MKLKDLNTGNVVVMKNNANHLVIKGTQSGDLFVDITNGENVSFDAYKNDMTFRGNNIYDIEKVYQYDSFGYSMVNSLNNTPEVQGILLWKRVSDAEQLLLDQINALKVQMTALQAQLDALQAGG